MSIRPIPRISAPNKDFFYDQFVANQQPVIISNLFKNDQISTIQTLKDAKDAFGDASFIARPEYTQTDSASAAIHKMSFRDYWNYIVQKPETKLVCTEQDVPAKVMASFQLPNICVNTELTRKELFDLPNKYGDNDLHLSVFMAGANNKAHLHYDGDHRQVLLYQVFGEKRVTLFHPDAGRKLRLSDAPYHCAGGIALDSLEEDERLRIVDDASGFIGTIFPGDTLYMPLLFWHHLDYSTDAMSFNIRFGRNEYGRFMCPDNFHRDSYLQIFGSRFGGRSDQVSESLRRGFATLAACYQETAPNLREKVRSMRHTLLNLCEQFCSAAKAGELYPSDQESALLDQIIHDVGPRMPYSPLDFIRQSRLLGSIAPAQKRQIESKAVASGYSQSILEWILFNRLGKSSLDSLTKPEASIFLSYLQSAGSSLNRHTAAQSV